MTNKEMLELLDDMFDKWIEGTFPESEDYSNMDKILNELREREREREFNFLSFFARAR